jgi:hypothetical protein
MSAHQSEDTLSLLGDFLSQDISRADVIAVGALLVGLLSAIYARRQSIEAKATRLAAVKESRRPQRVEVFRLSVAFCAFCGRYYTLYLSRMTKGTRELVAEIESFRWEIEQLGPLEMPEVETEIEKIQAMAWQLQRNLDKLGQQATLTQSAVAASATVTVIEQLVDLFAEKRVLLRTTFAPYLSEA